MMRFAIRDWPLERRQGFRNDFLSLDFRFLFVYAFKGEREAWTLRIPMVDGVSSHAFAQDQRVSTEGYLSGISHSADNKGEASLIRAASPKIEPALQHAKAVNGGPRATPKPWILPSQGLAVFHGDANTARLSHYFLPRLLLEGKRVLLLDGANAADPRLLERLARQRQVPFEQFNQQIQIARAFTCFQLTELIARVPRFLADFPAEVLIVTAFPELYYDEDVRDWNARVAFEQALAGLGWLAGAGGYGFGRTVAPVYDRRSSVSNTSAAHRAALQNGRTGLHPASTGEGVRDGGRVRDGLVATAALPLRVAVFSSASTFIPFPARKRFFEKTCAIAREVWKFSVGEDGRLGLACTRQPKRIESLSD